MSNDYPLNKVLFDDVNGTPTPVVQEIWQYTALSLMLLVSDTASIVVEFSDNLTKWWAEASSPYTASNIIDIGGCKRYVRISPTVSAGTVYVAIQGRDNR